MDILRYPYCHGIMGFAYVGKPINCLDSLQTVQTLFYPRLHSVTTTTLKGSHTVQYVVGNTTHYMSKEDPIYVCVDNLLNLATLPCVDIQYQHVFNHVSDWHKGNFYNIVGSTWAKSLISSQCDHHTKDTATLVYQPVSIPLSFGYAWDKYPIHMSKPPQWLLDQQCKKIWLEFAREKRSQKSKKIKISKAKNPTFTHVCTVDDNISITSRDSLDSARVSNSPLWEQEWVEAE